MQQPPLPYVRRSACEIDAAGGRCIGDHEMLTHRTDFNGVFHNAPRWPDIEEDEVSAIRGAVTKAAACRRRNQPAHPAEVAKVRIRYAVAGDLRDAGFAVIHTCGRLGHGHGHVSVIWPATNPLEEREAVWPAHVQAAFAACFTEQEG